MLYTEMRGVHGKLVEITAKLTSEKRELFNKDPTTKMELG